MHKLLLALALAVAALPAAAQSDGFYTVRRGDTLFRIAQAHGLTVERLRSLNGLSGDLIEVGQRLRTRALEPVPPRPPAATPSLPYEPPPPPPDAEVVALPVAAPDVPIPASGGTAVHVVQAGETLSRIARDYGTSVAALRQLNGLTGDRLAIGQRLAVARGSGPVMAPPPGARYDIEDSTVPADRVHFVKPGETLYGIAARYGVSAADLAASNRLTSAPLEPGTLLYLPLEAADHFRHPNPLGPADTTGFALVYPRSFEGRPTASGAAYDPDALTASHRTLALGTVVHVTRPAGGRSVLVRVTDRGPVSEDFLIELSEAAAAALGLGADDAERVELRVLR